VLTRHTLAERVNLERMRANVIEAAEQCGILRIPDIDEPDKLTRILEVWDPGRRLVFCDEDAEVTNPVAALAKLKRDPVAVLVGPEGGFSEDERAQIRAKPFALVLSLGPRVMRADTAAIAALALVNAVAGDWQ
jgi:16S rRNA (uracil1498-N3)-methyltransferase